MIQKDLNFNSDSHEVKKLETEKLKQIIFKDELPYQLVGNVGIGKTLTIKQLIKEDKEHIYIVFDCHNEYDLTQIQTITTDLKESSRIKMPEQISASRGLFPVYFNQLLSQKFPDNYVVVIEEAHRYKETKTLLKEARKFVKVIAILQEPIANFCPIVKIVD
jgi:type II secretory pathway predicted ATPase ExeA